MNMPEKTQERQNKDKRISARGTGFSAACRIACRSQTRRKNRKRDGRKWRRLFVRVLWLTVIDERVGWKGGKESRRKEESMISATGAGWSSACCRLHGVDHKKAWICSGEKGVPYHVRLDTAFFRAPHQLQRILPPAQKWDKRATHYKTHDKTTARYSTIGKNVRGRETLSSKREKHGYKGRCKRSKFSV